MDSCTRSSTTDRAWGCVLDHHQLAVPRPRPASHSDQNRPETERARTQLRVAYPAGVPLEKKLLRRSARRGRGSFMGSDQ